MSANPEHNTPPKDSREAVFCCDGVLCDIIIAIKSDEGKEIELIGISAQQGS
jgi:hypothetical protein